MNAHSRFDGIFPCASSLCLVTGLNCEAGIQGPQVYNMMREPAEAEMKSPPPPRTICGSPSVLVPSSTPWCFPAVRKGQAGELGVRVSADRPVTGTVTRRAC